jgi:hypothetical protein
MKRTMIAAVLATALAVLGSSAASASPAPIERGTQTRSTLEKGKLVKHTLRVSCWRSAQITVWEKNSLGQNLYHVIMNPVTWCARNGKISDVTYNRGSAAADKSPWGFDKWLKHGKVDGGVGYSYVHFREDAQFKAVFSVGTLYGHVFVDAYFYPDGRYAGTTGGN